MLNFRLDYLSADMIPVKPIRLSDEELKRLHKDGRPSNVRFSEEDGGGSMGALNIVHTLHCVVRTSFAISPVTLILKQCKGFSEEVHISR